MIIYFMKGTLPWQGLRAKRGQDKLKKILNIKENTNVKELCKDIPFEISNMLNYSRNLDFETEPDYDFYIRSFKKLIGETKITDELVVYDWEEFTSKKDENKDETIPRKTTT
jgi:hypothetical protein